MNKSFTFRNNIPNLITLLNLIFGVTAILIASSADRIDLSGVGEDINLIYFSCLLVMAAALFDRFDGKLARKLNATSAMGEQLDSLCDLISFGVAPAVIAWKLHFASTIMPGMAAAIIGYLIVMLFPVAGAVRLARFNVQEDKSVFFGIPITLAGSLLILFNLLNTFLLIRGRFGIANIVICMVLMLTLSYLMVCRIRLNKV